MRDETRVAAWGLTPLRDQQLAGLIMWMPSCLVYPAVGAVLVGCWLATRQGVEVVPEAPIVAGPPGMAESVADSLREGRRALRGV